MRNIFLRSVKVLSIAAFYVTTAAAQTIGGTRGLEAFDIDGFSRLAQARDMKGIAAWAADHGMPMVAAHTEALASRDFEMVSRNLALRLFAEQQGLRSAIDPARGATDEQRRRIVLLQTLIEELVMAIRPRTMTFNGSQLNRADEMRAAGVVRGVPVIPGDVIIQIGANYMSSHFIAYSQSNPGLASHSYLISKGGEKPEILEALIEDGVNRRDPTTAVLARFFVLSLPTAHDRAKAAAATARFIDTDREGQYRNDFIPFVPGGKYGTASPLLYDSTMNPERKKDGYYFCTALVQEVYQRAGLREDQIPFLADQTNWNSLRGLEKGVFEQIDIAADRVPAPTDVLFQPQFVVRSMVLDKEGLRQSRRLRAVVDAFYDILATQPEVREQLLEAFQRIPKLEVRKREVLAALGKIAADLTDHTAVQTLKAQLEESLPQTANLRQIAFFMILNAVIQDSALEALEGFETNELKRVAAPGELRLKATLWLGGHLNQIRDGLKAAGGRP